MISTMLWSFLVTAVVCDLKDYRIPNELIGLGYVASYYLNVLMSGPKGVIIFFLKGIWPIAVCYVLFLIKALGAGDIKLFSVIATTVGSQDMLQIIVMSLVLGAIVGLIRIIRRRKVFEFSHMHFSICIALSYFINYFWR